MRAHYMQMQHERTVKESTGDEILLWFQLYHHLQIQNKCNQKNEDGTVHTTTDNKREAHKLS